MDVDYLEELDRSTAAVKFIWTLLSIGLTKTILSCKVHYGDNINSKDLSIVSDGNVWVTECFDARGTHIYNTIYTEWWELENF